MIEAASALNGRVDHLNAVGHGYDQNVAFRRFRNATQEFSHFLDAMVARPHLTVGKKCLHLVDHEDGRRIRHCVVEHLRDLFAGLMDVRTGDARGINLEARPAEEIH
ncbi:hypothetical protein D3C86_1418310 [compost metagenome]